MSTFVNMLSNTGILFCACQLYLLHSVKLSWITSKHCYPVCQPLCLKLEPFGDFFLISHSVFLSQLIEILV